MQQISFLVAALALATLSACNLASENVDEDGPRIIDDDDEPAGEGEPGCVDDGLFCNGIARLLGDGSCRAVPAAPCDDGDPCTDDVCNETVDLCTHVVAQDDCATCASSGCVPDCTDRACGGNGCGGSCGTCDEGFVCAAVRGQCVAAGGLGTCNTPRVLNLATSETVTVVGDTTTNSHSVVPTCNSTSDAVEEVYSFTLTERVGIDARVTGFDTVLSLRSTCADDGEGATIACSDDAAPPGDFGSRVSALLEPGTYFLIVDGFDSTAFGPFTLTVRAISNCEPQCAGKFCGGDDGCGGDCGTCADEEVCGADFRCKPALCVPFCDGRSCGDDGCGSTCGDCAAGTLCVTSTSTCEPFAACDHLAPVCTPGCGPAAFCGSDCACHEAAEPLPDLVVAEARLRDEILIDHLNVPESSCAVVEECVGGTGDRRLLRFAVEAVNQGQATLTVPPPPDRPDLFEFSACHAHFHYRGFATYELLDAGGNVVVTGRKLAFCMEDTEQAREGPGVSCEKVFDCNNQGIQAGWSDVYGNSLDCQWLDITGVAAGDYTLRVSVNPDRTFEEVSFDNNTTSVPVTIPSEG
jgi:hypothetical protein